jgi:hypothetical protein
MRRQEPRERLHDRILADRHRHADGKLLRPVRESLELRRNRALIILQRPKPVPQHRPRRRQRQALVLIREKPRAIGLLEEMNLLRHARLREMQALRRAREIHELADRQKGMDTMIKHKAASSPVLPLSYHEAPPHRKRCAPAGTAVLPLPGGRKAGARRLADTLGGTIPPPKNPRTAGREPAKRGENDRSGCGITNGSAGEKRRWPPAWPGSSIRRCRSRCSGRHLPSDSCARRSARPS